MPSPSNATSCAARSPPAGPARSAFPSTAAPPSSSSPPTASRTLHPERFDATNVSANLVTYYEIDLTTHRTGHQLSLPGSGRGSPGRGHFAASVELSWHVDDPVAFVRGGTVNVSEQLLDHFIKEASRITRRHPLARASAAQHAVRSVLRRWPVPGLSVACSISLTPEGEQQPDPRSVPRPTERHIAPPDPSTTALVDTPNVLIGFDGPLVRLYTRAKEAQVTQELAALLAELRHPDAALGGEPLSPGGEPVSPLEGRSNPLDLLRAFAEHPLGADLRRLLNRIEERAVRTATATPFSDSLITTLNALGRRVAVVADNAPSAVWMYLQAHGRLTGLVGGGVHGRAEDLTRRRPWNPDCLLAGPGPARRVTVGRRAGRLVGRRADRRERHRSPLPRLHPLRAGTSSDCSARAAS